VEDSLTREHGGSGLGLSITKNLVDLLGGSIQVASEEGKGTVFIVSLPLIMESEEPEKHVIMDLSEEACKWRSKNLLLVEDTKINYLYIKEVLKKTGINILWVKNGEEAIDACRKIQDIDIVLMDIQMPVLNGFDATKAIKSFRPELPIIAQTAYTMAAERSKCHEAGCDDYLSKPILPQNLIASINHYFSYRDKGSEVFNP
jgi:CheY-like chemotaxis protein